MSIPSPVGEKKEFEITPKGNHLARVYQVIHLGTREEDYMGDIKLVDKVRITFELPTLMKSFKEGEPEKPTSIGQDYTNSMHEKANLCKLVEGITSLNMDEVGESFDVTELIGKECLLNVEHKTSAKGNQYAKIVSASPIPEGMPTKEAINTPFILDFNDNWSDEKFEKLPDFIKDKIKVSEEYKKMKGGDSDVPFD